MDDLEINDAYKLRHIAARNRTELVVREQVSQQNLLFRAYIGVGTLVAY